MKTNFQKGKLSLNRKTSGTVSNVKDQEALAEKKSERLVELRAKIEKERQIMRKSGKRFNKSGINSNSSKEIQGFQTEVKLEKTEGGFVKKEKRVAEICVGEESQQKVQEVRPVSRQTVDLTSLVTQTQELSLSSSRLFEKQLSQQKDRNQQIQRFLKEIGLQSFAEGLINLGYDELDILVEVTNEELNFLMMRASQQRTLTDALKEYKDKKGIKDTKEINQFLNTSTAFKVKVKNEALKEKKEEKVATSFRPKSAMTVASTNPTNNSGLFNSSVKPNPSFFVGIGGQAWSMDSLVRRACSGCFKIFPGGELIEEEGIFYCWPCKQKVEDPFSLSLNSSMVRDYKL